MTFCDATAGIGASFWTDGNMDTHNDEWTYKRGS